MIVGRDRGGRSSFDGLRMSGEENPAQPHPTIGPCFRRGDEAKCAVPTDENWVEGEGRIWIPALVSEHQDRLFAGMTKSEGALVLRRAQDERMGVRGIR